MQRFGYRFAAALALALFVAPTAPASGAPAQGSGQKVAVTSISMDAGGKVTVVARGAGEIVFADGTYLMGREAEVAFRESRILSATLRGALTPTNLLSQTRRNEYTTDTFSLDGDELMMKVEEGERPLPDGEFKLQVRAGRDHGRERRVTGFTVRGGKITEVMIDSFF